MTIALLAMGYLIGSLPMGVIVARLTGATDPRTVGSGRTGGTNSLRAMGWPRAIAVAALDLSQGRGTHPYRPTGRRTRRDPGPHRSGRCHRQLEVGLPALPWRPRRRHRRRRHARGLTVALPGRGARLLHRRRAHALRLAGFASWWPRLGAGLAVVFVIVGAARGGLAAVRHARVPPSSGSRTGTTSGGYGTGPSAGSTPGDRGATPAPGVRQRRRRSTCHES